MTAEMVAKLGTVDYRGQTPCIPQHTMVQIVIGLKQRPRGKRIINILHKYYGKNTSQRAS